MAKRVLVQAGIVMASVMLTMGVVTAADQTRLKDNASVDQFITDAAQGGLAEVSLGQMAADKGENEAVKDFGRRMVQDHGKANGELKSLATTIGVPVPTELSAQVQALQQRLGKLSGSEFDRVYMQEMVKDHQKDVAAFEKQAEHGQNTQVKDWAKKTLPTLKEHLDLAQRAEKRISMQNGTERDASGGITAAIDPSSTRKGAETTGDR